MLFSRSARVVGLISMSIPTTTGRWPSGLAYTAALIFTLASAGTNLVYGWHKGTDLPSSIIWAAVSLAVAIVFALSWPAVVGSIERRNWSRAFMAVLALLLTGAYSMTAALGSAAGGRTNATNQEQATTTARARVQTSYDSASTELSKLASSRPVAEVEALLAAARPVCRVHVTTDSRQTVCTKPPALLAELGRAKRRAELEQRLERAASDLSRTGAAKVANSDAAALAVYLSALGFETTTERLNRLLVLLAVLVIECGAGLSLAVGMALRPPASPRSEPAPKPVAPPRRSAPAPALPAPSPAMDRLLSHLQSQGGRVLVSQRQLGKELGISRVRVAQLLGKMAARGVVEVSGSTAGTSVRLIGP